MIFKNITFLVEMFGLLHFSYVLVHGSLIECQCLASEFNFNDLFQEQHFTGFKVRHVYLHVPY